MLSLDYCRGKLGASCALEDKELKRIRDSLYSLAAVIISVFKRGKTARLKDSEKKLG